MNGNDEVMKVWVYTARTPNKKFNYVHVFTGKRHTYHSERIKIDRSILEFGGHAWRQNFQKPGEEIFLPSRIQQRDLKVVAQWIIKDMFKGRFDLGRTSFKAGLKV